MKMLKKAAVAMAAVSLVASPGMAGAAPSLDVRMLSVAANANENNSNTPLIIAGVVGAAVLIAVVADGNNNNPTSR